MLLLLLFKLNVIFFYKIPIFKSILGSKINERIEYKLIFQPYNLRSMHLCNLISVQPRLLVSLVSFDRLYGSFQSAITTTSLSCTVSEILSVISQYLMRSRDPENIPLWLVYHVMHSNSSVHQY